MASQTQRDIATELRLDLVEERLRQEQNEEERRHMQQRRPLMAAESDRAAEARARELRLLRQELSAPEDVNGRTAVPSEHVSSASADSASTTVVMDSLNALALESPASTRPAHNVGEYAEWLMADARANLNAVGAGTGQPPSPRRKLLEQERARLYAEQAPSPQKPRQPSQQQQRQQAWLQQQQQQQQQNSARSNVSMESLASTVAMGRSGIEDDALRQSLRLNLTGIRPTDVAAPTPQQRQEQQQGSNSARSTGKSGAVAVQLQQELDKHPNYQQYVGATLHEIDQMLASLGGGGGGKKGAAAAAGAGGQSARDGDHTLYDNFMTADNGDGGRNGVLPYDQLLSGPLDAVTGSVSSRSHAPRAMPSRASAVAGASATSIFRAEQQSGAGFSGRGATVDMLSRTGGNGARTLVDAGDASLYGVKPGTAGTRARPLPASQQRGSGGSQTARSASSSRRSGGNKWLSPEERKLKKFLLNLQRLRKMEHQAYQAEVKSRELERLKFAVTLQQAAESNRLSRDQMDLEIAQQQSAREQRHANEMREMQIRLDAERKIERHRYQLDRNQWAADLKRWESSNTELTTKMEMYDRERAKMAIEHSQKHEQWLNERQQLLSQHVIALEEKDRGFEHERKTFDTDRRQWQREREELRAEVKSVQGALNRSVKQVSKSETAFQSLNADLQAVRKENDYLKNIIQKIKLSRHYYGYPHYQSELSRHEQEQQQQQQQSPTSGGEASPRQHARPCEAAAAERDRNGGSWRPRSAGAKRSSSSNKSWTPFW